MYKYNDLNVSFARPEIWTYDLPPAEKGRRFVDVLEEENVFSCEKRGTQKSDF